MRPLYTVIFRTGGTERFRWRRVYIAALTSDDVELLRKVEGLERMGYASKVVTLGSVQDGMPTDYLGVE